MGVCRCLEGQPCSAATVKLKRPKPYPREHPPNQRTQLGLVYTTAKQATESGIDNSPSIVIEKVAALEKLNSKYPASAAFEWEKWVNLEIVRKISTTSVVQPITGAVNTDIKSVTKFLSIIELATMLDGNHNVMKYLSIFLLIIIVSCKKQEVSTNKNTVSDETVWNVKSKYGGINAQTLQVAINEAIQFRIQNPDSTIVLLLDNGTYYINKQLDVQGTNENGTGWLIIRGKGDSVTELVDIEYTSDTDNTFDFKTPYRVKLMNFRITGQRFTSSQGTVTNIDVNNKTLDVKIDNGYPNINELYGIDSSKANKLRIFDDTGADGIPHFVEGPNNNHYIYRIAFNGTDVPGKIPILIAANTWRLTFPNSDLTVASQYFLNKRIGVSSKSNRSNWAAFSGGGKDFVIENVSFLRLGRCKFRGTWTNIRFTNVKILRSLVNGKLSFYSTDAGPQIGQDADNADLNNVIMENCDFRGTVDDGSAFQKVKSGKIFNNYWEDGGGVLIGVNCSKNLLFQSNSYVNCPLEDMR